MKAAIIAGGFGKRLRPYTQDRPKPLIEVLGKPIIQWQIEHLRKFNVDTVVVLAGYLRNVLIDYLGSGNRLGVSIVYVVEEEPLGTGGAIKNAESVLKDEFFVVLNGDIITNIPVDELVERLLEEEGAVANIALVPLRSPYGIVELGEGGFVTSFKEKPILEDHLINAGIYAFRPEIFKYLPRKGSIEKETFPKLAREGKLLGTVFKDVYWRSIDTVKDVEEANRELSSMKW